MFISLPFIYYKKTDIFLYFLLEIWLKFEPPGNGYFFRKDFFFQRKFHSKIDFSQTLEFSTPIARRTTEHKKNYFFIISIPKQHFERTTKLLLGNSTPRTVVLRHYSRDRCRRLALAHTPYRDGHCVHSSREASLGLVLFLHSHRLLCFEFFLPQNLANNTHILHTIFNFSAVFSPRFRCP